MSDQINRERISVLKCRSILKQTGVGLSDEQIIAIRNYLYDLAQIDYDIFMSEEAQTEGSEKVKPINQNTNENDKTESADFQEAA